MRFDASHIAGNRLNDHAGNLVPTPVELRFHRILVIKWKNCCQFSQARRHARTVGKSQRRNTRTRTDQKTVAVPVIATIKFDNSFARRVAPRQPDGGHGSLSSGTDKPDLFHRRKKLGDQFGKLDFRFRWRAEGGADRQYSIQRFHHFGRTMPENQGSPGAHEIDVLFTIDVPDPRAIPPLDENGFSANRSKGPNRRIYAPRDDLLCAIEETFGAIHAKDGPPITRMTPIGVIRG